MKKDIVILISTGDRTSRFTDLANQIASELKSSGVYREVFFNRWLPSNDLDGNLEKLVSALHRSTVVVLFATPFGKSSYENYVQKGQLATWKDEFVIAAHSLFHHTNHASLLTTNQIAASATKGKKVLVVYNTGDDVIGSNDVITRDFKESSHRCYDLANEDDYLSLYKELLPVNNQRKLVNIDEQSLPLQTKFEIIKD